MRVVFLHGWILSLVGMLAATAQAELPIAPLERTESVDFHRELMPILRRKCVACHHDKEAQGGLSLETFSSVVAGGDSGEGIVPHDPAISVVFARAAGLEEPLMPPEGNAAKAEHLTPHELALFKLWIQQGAPGSDDKSAALLEWQPIPASVRDIYALDVSEDGRILALGQGNRAWVIDLEEKMAPTPLVDATLPQKEVAGIDVVSAVAISPDGQRVATGDFRTVRVWQKVREDISLQSNPLELATGPIAANGDQTQIALVNAVGEIEIWNLPEYRHLHTLVAHRNEIVGLIWNNDSGRIYAADEAGLITVWEISSGTQVAQFDAQVTIRQLAVSPPGETIALVSGTGQVHAFGFQAESDGAPASITPIGQEWAEISDASAVVVASTPQPRLAIASQARGIVLVNVADRQVTATIATETPVSCLALSADQGVLAGGDPTGKVHLWNLADGTLLRTLEGTSEANRQKAGLNQAIERQKQEIARLQGQLPGLEQLLAAEVEVVTKASSARDEAATALANAQEEHSTSQKSLMASEEMLASAQAASMKAAEALPKLNQKAAMLAEQKGKAQQALDEVKGKADEAAQVLSEAQAKLDELQMLTTKRQEQLQQLQQQEDRLKQKIDQLQKEEQEARQRIEATQQKLETQRTEVAKKAEAVASAESLLVNREQALSASTDAKNRAEAAVPAHRTRIAAQERKLARVEERLQVRQQDLTSPAQAVYGLAWDAAGEKLATVHRTGTIRVYRVSDGKPLDAIDVPASAMPRGVAWVGQTLSSWSSRAAARRFSTTFRWELTRTIGDLHGGPISDRVTALAFHPDGLLLAIGSGIPSRTGEVVVVSADSGEVVRTFGQLHSDTVECLQFSPDGRLLASGAADKTIHLIDVADSRSVKTLEGHTHHVVALAWLAQPQQLASAAADQTLKVWDIESGQPIRTIGGLPDQPSGMSLLGATTQCLVGDIQGNLRVVDAATGQTLRSFRAPGGFMYRVATTPDGQFAFTGGKDGKARMWNVADGSQTLEIDPAATSSGADFD